MLLFFIFCILILCWQKTYLCFKPDKIVSLKWLLSFCVTLYFWTKQMSVIPPLQNWLAPLAPIEIFCYWASCDGPLLYLGQYYTGSKTLGYKPMTHRSHLIKSWLAPLAPIEIFCYWASGNGPLLYLGQCYTGSINLGYKPMTHRFPRLKIWLAPLAPIEIFCYWASIGGPIMTLSPLYMGPLTFIKYTLLYVAKGRCKAWTNSGK